MKKASKKPVKPRRVWPRNPKTQVEKSATAYNRHKEKRIRNNGEEYPNRNIDRSSE